MKKSKLTQIKLKVRKVKGEICGKKNRTYNRENKQSEVGSLQKLIKLLNFW